MSIRRELIDELLKEYPNQEDVLAEDGLLKQLTKAVIERVRAGNGTGYAPGLSQTWAPGLSPRQHAQRLKSENGQGRAGAD